MKSIHPVEKNSIPANPIQAALDRSGLSALKFSTVLGVSSITVRFALTGEAIHPKVVIRGLQALGYDPADVLEKYTAWRGANRARLIDAANGRTIISMLARTSAQDDQGDGPRSLVSAGPGPSPTLYERGVW